jgi:hypothetical protein
LRAQHLDESRRPIVCLSLVAALIIWSNADEQRGPKDTSESLEEMVIYYRGRSRKFTTVAIPTNALAVKILIRRSSPRKQRRPSIDAQHLPVHEPAARPG